MTRRRPTKKEQHYQRQRQPGPAIPIHVRKGTPHPACSHSADSSRFQPLERGSLANGCSRGEKIATLANLRCRPDLELPHLPRQLIAAKPLGTL
jgi:hypothetical protein